MRIQRQTEDRQRRSQTTACCRESNPFKGLRDLDNFDDYSEELWKHFEVVTGLKSPIGEDGTTMPPFRCSC